MAELSEGGAWANNPVMVALADDPRWEPMALARNHIGSHALAGQNALGQAGLLIGRDRLIRIDASATPDEPIKLDDLKRVKEDLPAIGIALASQNSQILKTRFFFELAGPYSAFAGPRSGQ